MKATLMANEKPPISHYDGTFLKGRTRTPHHGSACNQPNFLQFIQLKQIGIFKISLTCPQFGVRLNLLPLTYLFLRVFQESVHSTWLNNGLTEFQSRLTDALTGAASAASGDHSPLTRAAAAASGSKPGRPPPVGKCINRN